MRKIYSILGHSGAVLSVVAVVLGPFLLYGWFQKAIGSAGLRINPEYSGGDAARVIQRDGYRIVVNHPVTRQSPFQRVHSFVQMTWTPAAQLPGSVSEDVDLDGDGNPDVRVNFSPARLDVDVQPLTARYQASRWQGVQSFSKLIARVGDGVVVRLPLD